MRGSERKGSADLSSLEINGTVLLKGLSQRAVNLLSCRM